MIPNMSNRSSPRPYREKKSAGSAFRSLRASPHAYGTPTAAPGWRRNWRCSMATPPTAPPAVITRCTTPARVILAVNANRLIAEGAADRVLIVDLDVHQGDGTASLMAGRTDVFTFSMHAAKNFPVRKARSGLDVELADGTGDEDYLAELARHLPVLLDGFRPDIVLYQAGVDPHHDDRLGRLALSDEGLEQRDTYVVDQVRRRGLPVASALGGGYGADQHAVAARHAASMLAMARENARHPAPPHGVRQDDR